MTPIDSALDHIGFDTLFDATPTPDLVISPQLTLMAANEAAAILGAALGTSRVGFGTIDPVRDWCDGVGPRSGSDPGPGRAGSPARINAARRCAG